jgi:acyl-CoA dehydrogenase
MIPELDLELDDEHALLRSVVREFVTRELIPLEKQVGDDGMPPELRRQVAEKARAVGLWALDVPQELGGAGLDVLGRVIVAVESGRTIAIRPRRPGIYGPDVSPILYECDADQRERYLYPVIRGERVCGFAQTEVGAGSDPSGMTTTAVRDGDHYVLNGAKHFISHVDSADCWIVVALTDPARRARGGISCFLVDADTPGLSRGERWPMLMGDAPGDLYLDRVRVPAASLIGGEGGGFRQAQRHLTIARVAAHGARAVGMAERALELMLGYAPQRVTFGEPLSERQAIQFMIADSAMELYAVKLMLYECARRLDRGDDVRNESYMLKVQSAEMVHRVVDRAIQVHGGMGLARELPLETMYREARMFRITEGSSEVLRWRLARNLLRRVGPPS